MTINRFCSSGLQAVADAADRIRLGEADVMIAAGTESMSMVPMGGNKSSSIPAIFEKDENVAIAYGMGITAERVAEQWKISVRTRTVRRREPPACPGRPTRGVPGRDHALCHH
jgi:acetyl-CoA acyltransferase